jgi:plasmid maintenance system antidote protein VapI
MAKHARKRLDESLRKAIMDSGKSINAVATESGISQAVLQRFATGQRSLTLETAERLAAYFGLELRTSREK